MSNVRVRAHRPGIAARLGGLVRLGHPFPSVLDGVVTGLLATVAGAAPARALVLAVAMTALQVSIGALNDLVDVERDRGYKPGKPIPAGLIERGTARVVAAAGFVLGLGLSATAGVAPMAIAAVGTAAGYLYDLRLKATPGAWLPFAVGIPLLPVYAWVGATGRLPAAFALLLPLAVLAGAGLALANGLVDVERDRAAGLVAPAIRLGPARAWRLAAGLQAVVALGALGSLVAVGATTTAIGLAVGGVGLAAVGVALDRAGDPGRRERGWEALAIGLGLLAAGWAVGFAERGLL